jgi:RNA polymerase sigma factor for flagellar operon FliA
MMSTVRGIAAGIAKRLPRHVEMEDLVGAGSLGLAEAFSRRGAMTGHEFENFAACRIRGAMLDELRQRDSMTRGSRQTAKRLAKAARAVEQRIGRPATEEEIASELSLDLSAYHALCAKVTANRAPVAFSALGESDDVVRNVADPSDHIRLSILIARHLETLSERQRTVLVRLYVEGMTLKEVGISLGVTESRVCQIHSEALAALRAALSEQDVWEEAS